MNYCSHCGAQLGIGRFCTNCGARIVASTVPAPDPALDPAPDPAPVEQTLLYDALPDAPAGQPAAADPPDRDPHRRVVAIGAGVLLVLLVLVAWLARDGAPAPDEVAAARADEVAGRSADRTAPSGPLEDVAASAGVEAPPPVPPGRSLAGEPVSYAAANLTDGDTTTAYRVRGDATGTVLTFRWPEPVTLHEVGLVNGYAKTDSANGVAVNWYAANRKVLRVRWTFDDGTTVEQELRPDPDLQTVEAPGVATRTVRLELLAVSPPGAGPRGRDVTALSEVVLRAG